MTTRAPGSTYHRARRSLGRALRSLREEAGLSGNQLSKRLGWAQSKVSRIETARQLPTEEDVDVWLSALASRKVDRARVILLLTDAREEYNSWRDNYGTTGGPGGKQREILALERQARRIREFQPAFIPGLLQTRDYARELLELPFGPRAFGASADDLDDMLGVRMERQQVLFRHDVEVEILILEAALTTRVCGLDTLLQQLNRLRELSIVNSLTVGIVPAHAPLEVFPLGGFTVYDGDLVVVESIAGEQQVSDHESVAVYSACFESVATTAIKGSKALGLIDSLVETLGGAA